VPVFLTLTASAEPAGNPDQQVLSRREGLEDLGQHYRHVIASTVIVGQLYQLLTNDVKTSIKSLDS
jgi:hypothetical protein